MNKYLQSLWNNQLNNNHAFSVPLYNGDNIDHTKFDKNKLSSSAYFIREVLPDEIKAYIVEFSANYKFDTTYLVIDRVDVTNVDNNLTPFTKVDITYRFLNEAGDLVDKHTTNLINYPSIGSNNMFKVNNNYFSFIDELVNDYEFNFKKYDEYSDITIRIEDGVNYTIRSYFNNYNILIVKKYSEILESVVLDEVTDFTNYDILSKKDVINKFIDVSDCEDNESIINRLIENKNLLVADDIKSKKIISGYAKLKAIIFDAIRYNFNASRKYNKTKISRTTLRAVTSKLFTDKSFSYASDTNPLSYLSTLRKLDLMGDHGPDRSNLEMREYRESYVNYIDPLETPESGKLGLVIHRSCSSFYDKSGKLQHDNLLHAGPNSFNFSALTIPFIHNNDSIRCSMGAGHIKQALPLTYPEVPLVSTGSDRLVESLLNNRVESPVDGSIVMNTEKSIIILDANNNYHTIKTPSPQFNNEDTMINYYPRYDSGSYVKAGEQLFNNNQYNDGHLTLGRNVLIAYFPYLGLNYEDSVVISESLASNLTTEKYKVIEYTMTDKLIESHNLPSIGEEVNPEKVIMTFRKSDKRSNLIDIYSDQISTITYGVHGTVVKINKVNDKNVEDKEYTKVIITLATPHLVEVGDKLSFTSAAKCIISKILSDELMPKTHDGRVIDIIYNTIGIPSRMNLSQLFEASLGFLNKLIIEKLAVDNSKENLMSILSKINSVLFYDNINDFIDFIHELDDEAYTLFINNFSKQFVFEVKQFDSSLSHDKITELYNVLELNDTFNPADGRKVYLPEFGKFTKFEVFYGYSRVLVLKHQVSAKKSAVSYSGLSDCREKNQRIGEMEMLALEAHGCNEFINETTLLRSNINNKLVVLRDIVSSTNSDKLLDLSNYKKMNANFDEFSKVMRSMGVNVTQIQSNDLSKE